MNSKHTIPAEVHSDDHVHEVDFDAVTFFQEASAKEIYELAECDWGGDYPADYVAQSMKCKNAAIDTLFDYLDRIQGTRQSCGFECHVDKKKAMKWLKKHRPEIADTIERRA